MKQAEIGLLARPRSLSKQVAQVLAERIITGGLSTGSLLPPERELGESLGVSRTVVREATKLLESQGLVSIEHGKGTVIREARQETVVDSLKLLLRRRAPILQDLLEVRLILEVEIASFAAIRRTEANLQELQKQLKIMREQPDRPSGYVDADVAFHLEIARATQNPVFLILLEPLSDLLRESRIASFCGAKMVQARTRQHERIYRSILEKNVEESRAAMREHLSDTGKDLRRGRAKRSRGAAAGRTAAAL